MKDLEKIIELGVEGGSIAIYMYFDEKRHDLYYHQVNEMGWEDLEISGINRKSKQISISFPEAMMRMIQEYPDVMSYYPLITNPKYRLTIIEFLKTSRKEIEFHKDEWFKLLNIQESDLDVDILDQYGNLINGSK